MTEGWKDRFVKVFALSLIVVVFIGGLLVAWPAFRRGQSLRLQDAELAERMEAGTKMTVTVPYTPDTPEGRRGEI